MTVSQLTYALQKGFVHHWLVAGPQVVPAENIEGKVTGELLARVYQQYHPQDSGITQEPAETGPLEEGQFKVGDYEGVWSYLRCAEDHFIDHSARYGRLVYLRSWAFTELFSAVAQSATLALTSSGPADVWLNGQLVHHHEHFQSPEPKSVPFEVQLAAGLNKLLIQFEAVCRGACPQLLALQVCQAQSREPIQGVHVEIPTLIEQVERRNELEEAFETIYANRDVYTQEDKIGAFWTEDLPKNVLCDVRLEAPGGMIYAHAEVNGDPGDKVFLAYASTLQPGPYKVFLMPRGWEYYEKEIRISKDLPIWVIGDNAFSATPSGDFQERRLEAFKHALRIKNNLYAEMARMALGLWKELDLGVIQRAIAQVNGREAGSVEALIGLLRMSFSFSRRPEYPKQIKNELKGCLRDYRYWLNEPGANDADFCAEDEQILFHTCEILAGQRYPDLVFTNNGETGRKHRRHGERMALEWLHAWAATGFSHWNSDAIFAKALTALSLLVDFSINEDVAEMAAIVMDKIFYALALNTFQGVLGASSGQTSLPALLGGYLQETAGVTRVMWGQGLYNQHLAAPVSLACTREYELPLIFIDIAQSTPEALWSREKHQVSAPDGPHPVHISTFRSPDGLLSSAQDYQPGQPGHAEHIWQATLGPGATVFVNHPANASRSDALPNNYWLGNRLLPRVAQWNDCLIALYPLPAGDWMGFTHAYFPTFAFDDYVLRDGWAFARKGNGYLALTASNGIELTQQGREALRELRSPGPQTVWVCQMGRALRDGSFADFQEQVLARKVVFEGLSAQVETIRGERLSFSWEGSFKLDGQEVPLKSDRHYESLFGVADFPPAQMDIQYGDRLLRLDLSSGKGGDVA